jgi:hypothetical protein
MQDLLTACAQMAMSLAFHIAFACVGVTMPLLMAIAEWRHLEDWRRGLLHTRPSLGNRDGNHVRRTHDRPISWSAPS